MRVYILTILFVALLANLFACRIIVPPPPPMPTPEPRLQNIEVRKHNVEVTIQDGIATTVLETVFYNPNPRQLEGTYLFPLPEGASIAQFSMWIDGKEMQAELLDATKARDLYISIVSRMIDPGLLEFVGRETFKMRIFPIPAMGEKKVKLSYQHQLRTQDNVMNYVYPLTTVGNGRDDTLGEFTVKVNISSQIPLKTIFSPSHAIKVDKGENKATVTFEASRIQPDKDFNLYISRSDEKIDLTLIPYHKGGAGNGYFLLMLSPKVAVDPKEEYPKDVVFVFDTSGSMLVKDKIGQAKDALKYCLSALKPGDRFNIVTFATKVTQYNREQTLIPATKENIQEAVAFVEEKVQAGGGTNIDSALTTAIALAPRESKRPFMIFFLTDGEPTYGVTDPKQILANVQKANVQNLRIFTFGVGTGLNAKLLDQLTEQNRGDREYVDFKENIEVKVSSLFDKVSSPVLHDIQIEFPKLQTVTLSEIYPKAFPDLFKGAQISVVGRYSGNGDQAIKITGLVGEQRQEFVYEVNFPSKMLDNHQIPRLWAVRKVGFLLDQIRLEGESAGLKEEVVKLAEEFGIVTPYTSYLVVEDDIRITGGRPRPIVNEEQAPAAPSAVWRERVRSAPEPAAEAKGAASDMETASGEGAVKASRALQSMQKAQVADAVTDEDKADAKKTSEWMRKIDEKTFYLKANVWYDSSYDGKAAKTRIRYMSQEYFDLIKHNPGIGKFLILGSAIVVVFENKVYEIHP